MFFKHLFFKISALLPLLLFLCPARFLFLHLLSHFLVPGSSSVAQQEEEEEFPGHLDMHATRPFMNPQLHPLFSEAE